MSGSATPVDDEAGSVAEGSDRYHPLDSPVPHNHEFLSAYLASDGREGHEYRGGTALLLTMRGRVSGQWRRTPLLYTTDGDDYLIAGSNAGRETDPQWVSNIRAEPEVVVQVLGDVFDGRAEVITGEERQRRWDLLVDAFPTFGEYQSNAKRSIPVIRISRT